MIKGALHPSIEKALPSRIREALHPVLEWALHPWIEVYDILNRRWEPQGDWKVPLAEVTP